MGFDKAMGLQRIHDLQQMIERGVAGQGDFGSAQRYALVDRTGHQDAG